MNDLDRLRLEYADRERRFAQDDRYSTSNAGYRFMKAQLNRKVQRLLGKERTNISNHRILEVGCGNGNVLMDFHNLGANKENLFGIDLLPPRLQKAQLAFPLLKLANADGQSLPFPSHAFDLVVQFTAISSILDNDIRRNICTEMLRVVRKEGLILSYDFWLNPANPQTRGVRPEEIRRYFPGCRFEFQRITLAPPIARWLASLSWGLCTFLESLKILNTHYLAAIRPV